MKRNLPPKSQTIAIYTEMITLGQLLKHANLIGSGGEVRDFLEANPITVNGEAENRRGRKIRPGDTVVCGNLSLNVVARSRPEIEDES